MAPLTVSQLISNRLTPMLGRIQRLEANNHLGQIQSVSGTQTVYSFPFGNWNTAFPPTFRLANSSGNLAYTPAAYDPVAGTVTVNSIEPGMDLYANYHFQYFSTSDLTSFYLLAMSFLNNIGPVSYFTLDDSVQGTSANYPFDFEHFLSMYAYKLCIETLMGDLMTRNTQMIFSNLQDFSSFLQGKVSEFDNYLNAIKATLKGRRFISPKSVSQGRYSTPAQVTDSNWQQYTSIRSNS